MDKPVTVAIYARVSTEEQKLEMQLHDLRLYVQRQGWEAVEYLEKESSMNKRPVFDRMLEDGRRGKLSVILVWRIDRFARSMKDFVNVCLQLDSWKVRLISTTESVDTGDQNPFAEFQRGLLMLLAQLERKIIIARVNAGIAAAKRKGVHCGRSKKIWNRAEARDLRATGLSVRAIAKQLGKPVMTIQDALRAK